MSAFETLNNINVNDKVEKKNGLSYLSWAWAWGEVKKAFPEATYTIYEVVNPNGYICNYYTDGCTCWVKTGVTINGIEHIEELPVMDFRNKSIPLDKVTSFDVNKAIQRSLTKAIARHGLGLYIYAGEDLPEEEANHKDDAKVEELMNNISSKIIDLQHYGVIVQDSTVRDWICDKARVDDLNYTIKTVDELERINKVMFNLLSLKKKQQMEKEKAQNGE